MLLFCCSFLSVAQQVSPISTEFQATPNKCVALNQGRECFTMVVINWQLPELTNVCVFIQYAGSEMTAIECWDEKRAGQVEYEFQSAQDATLFLTRQPSNQTLASTTIHVSWLYQATSRKRRWRLF